MASRSKQSGRSTRETDGGTMSGFVKTGKGANRQFTEKTPGQTERGFKQKTEKEVTAAMQGTSMPDQGGDKWQKPVRADARKQFGSAPGKKVF